MPIFGQRLMGFVAGGGGSAVLASSQNNVNLRTLFGNPTSSGVYTVTVNSGVTIGAMDTGSGWVTGQQIVLVNRGNVDGLGGAAGTGGVQSADGTNGGAGGNALNLQWPVTIDNASGNIRGGGGGGGGGGGTTSSDPPDEANGGNGAAGRGYNNAGGSLTGSAGTTGTFCVGGTGGNGGDYGAAGSSGGNGTGGSLNRSGGTGGAAGKAINTNGHAVTWIAGNNGTQVKGTVG